MSDDLAKSISKLLNRAIGDFAKSLAKELGGASEDLSVVDEREGEINAPVLSYEVDESPALDSSAPDDLSVNVNGSSYEAEPAAPLELGLDEYSTQVEAGQLDASQPGELQAGEFATEPPAPLPPPQTMELAAQVSAEAPPVGAVEPLDGGGFEGPLALNLGGSEPPLAPATPLDVEEASQSAAQFTVTERDFPSDEDLGENVSAQYDRQTVGRDALELMMAHQGSAHEWSRRSSEKTLEMYDRMSRDMANDYWRLDSLVNSYERGRSTITDFNI